MSEFQRKNSFTEKTAKSVSEATELALKELGVTENEVDIEVVDEGAKGFLGIGARDAVVRVALKGAKKKETAAKKTEPVKNSSKIITDTPPEQEAARFLEDVFAAMDIEVAVKAEAGEENTVNVDLSGDNMGIIIGKRGDTLDSLQYLTSLVVNRHSEDYIKVSLDTENYREKREEALLALAKRLSEKVVRTGKKFTLEPMNPYERRIIHSSLQNNEEVTTFSVGTEPYRKVVIAPKNPKPYNKKKSYKKPAGDRHHNTHKPVKEDVTAENVGSYTTTYKADFKPTQHKAEFKTFEDYLAAHNSDH